MIVDEVQTMTYRSATNTAAHGNIASNQVSMVNGGNMLEQISDVMSGE